jgi:ankyrin repeat protein
MQLFRKPIITSFVRNFTNQTFYKVTNARECHNGYQYRDGLNILKEPFNDDPKASCCPGGFYFTDVKNVFKYIDYGENIRQVTLPLSNPEFKIVQDPSLDKWRANMLVLGERHSLHDVATYRHLIDASADINADNGNVLYWNVRCGNLDVVKYLYSKGANAPAKDMLQICASSNHSLELVIIRFLLQQNRGVLDNHDLASILEISLYSENHQMSHCLKEYGANISALRESFFLHCARFERLSLLRFLVEFGIDIHTYDEKLLRVSAQNGHLEMVRFLVNHGANIHAKDDDALCWSARLGHLDIVRYLVEHGANVQAVNNCPLRWSAECGHYDVVRYLIEKGANAMACQGAEYRVYTDECLKIATYLKSLGVNISIWDPLKK